MKRFAHAVAFFVFCFLSSQAVLAASYSSSNYGYESGQDIIDAINSASSSSFDLSTDDINKIDEIGDVQNELDAEREKSQSYAKQTEELSEEISSVNNRLSSLAVSIGESKEALKLLDDEIESNEGDIEKLAAKRDRLKGFLYAYIKFSYEKQAGRNISKVFMESKSISEVLDREYYASRVLEYFYAKLDEYADLNALYTSQQEKLVSLKSEQEKTDKTLTEQKAEFDRLLQELSEALSKAKENADEADRKAEILEQELAALEEEERKALEAAAAQIEYTSGYEDTGGGIVESQGTIYRQVAAYSYTDDELKLLAGIMQAEAGSTYPGMVAVGSVVMNRVDDGRFPNTIEGVIYSPGQFTPASSGRLALILSQGPSELAMQAAKDVLSGKRNVSNLYFKAAWYAKEHGISGVNIGGNVFH